MTVDSLVSRCGNLYRILFRVYDASGDEIAEFWNDEYILDVFSYQEVYEYEIQWEQSLASGVVKIFFEEDS